MEPNPERTQPPVNIQRLTPDQWKIYQGLRYEMLMTDPSAFPPQAFNDLQQPEEKWRSNIADGIVLVAFDGLQPAGMVRGTISGEKGIARNMYTRLMYRSQGVGRRLMTELLAKFEASDGINLVELEVEDTQLPARRMYEQFGFRQSGIQPEGNHFMITMQKTL